MEKEKLKEEQIKIWERIVEDIEKIPFEDRSFKNMLMAASALNGLEKYDEAFEILQILEEEQIKEYELKFSREMGITLSHLEKYEDAFKYFSTYFEKPQRDAKACYEFACVLGQSRKNEKALEYLKDALEMKSPDVDIISIYSEMAWNYTQLERVEEALKYYKIVEEAGRDDFWLNMQLGLVYLMLDNTYLGLNYLLSAEEHALYNKMSVPSLLTQIATLLGSLGKYSEALEYLNRAKAEGYTEMALYTNLGFNLTELGEFDEALKNFFKAVELGKDDGWIYSQIGYCYGSLDRFEEALEYLLKAKKFYEDDAEWLDYQLGIVYKKLGEYKEALKYLKKYSNNRELRELVNLEIADIYAELGDKKNGLLHLKKASKGTHTKNPEISKKYQIVTDNLARTQEFLS